MPARFRPRHPRSRRALAAVTAAVAAVLLGLPLLTGFHAPVHEQPRAVAGNTSGEVAPGAMIGIRTFTAPAGLRTVSGVQYATEDDGGLMRLDVCAPSTPATVRRAGVLVVHGGAWSHGDKSGPDWHGVCQWLASEGFVAYDADYSLSPGSVFPRAVDELQQAVEWIRRPANVARYDIDPARVGVFGGSAGGNLAALLATRGSGSLTTGSRVAALVDLSGPVDLTEHGQELGIPARWLAKYELAYLGCTDFSTCPQARAASAVYQVDPSDPPTFIAGAAHEIVPIAQGREFAAALAAAGVPHRLVEVPGTGHSIGNLDASLRRQIATFLRSALPPRS